MVQKAAKKMVALRRMRSTVAPMISAKVMMANASWNMKKADSGTVRADPGTQQPVAERPAQVSDPGVAGRECQRVGNARPYQRDDRCCRKGMRHDGEGV